MSVVPLVGEVHYRRCTIIMPGERLKGSFRVGVIIRVEEVRVGVGEVCA